MQRSLHEIFGKINDVQNLCAFIFGILGGMFSIYGSCPLACAVMTAFALCGGGELMAACGACVGIIISRTYTAQLAVGVCAILNMVWKLWRGDALNSPDRLLILAVAQLSLIFIQNESLHECIAVALMCMLSIIAAILLRNGICAVKRCAKRRRLATDNELISICIFAGIAVLLMSPLSTQYLSVAFIASGLTAMLGACVSSPYGLTLAIISATGAGYNYLTGVFSLGAVGTLALACALCSTVKVHGKNAVAAMFFAVSTLFGAVITRCASLPDCVTASIMFAFMPKRIIYAADAYLSVGKQHDTAIKRKLQMLSKATMGISDALSANELSGDGQLAIRQLGAITSLLDDMGLDNKMKSTVSVEVGIACIPKNKCAHTGDSVGTADCGGKSIITVSDGMGSGILAHNESAAAVECFVDMTRAGFNTCDSIDCVNRRLISRCETDFYATLDALVIDKGSCIATSVKLGAPPSFLVREGAVHTISGESLPLGIIESVAPAVKKFRVQEDDIFIIVTDGVTDALGKNMLACITDTVKMDKSVEQLANELLDIASYDGAQDDMSVVCARVRGKQ